MRNIRSLQFFVAIAETKSIKRAAGLLGVSQSALFQFHRKIEMELGHPCFLKDQEHQLILTPFGLRYYQYCRDMLSLYLELMSQLSSLENRPTKEDL